MWRGVLIHSDIYAHIGRCRRVHKNGTDVQANQTAKHTNAHQEEWEVEQEWALFNIKNILLCAPYSVLFYGIVEWFEFWICQKNDGSIRGFSLKSPLIVCNEFKMKFQLCLIGNLQLFSRLLFYAIKVSKS